MDIGENNLQIARLKKSLWITRIMITITLLCIPLLFFSAFYHAWNADYKSLWDGLVIGFNFWLLSILYRDKILMKYNIKKLEEQIKE